MPRSGARAMSGQLPSPAWAKFVKVAGLLASDHDGERANAAKMATDILREHRTTWGEVLTEPGQPCPRCGAARTAQEERDRFYRAARDWTRDSWPAVVTRCLHHDDLLSDWKLSFLHSIRRRSRLSQKQETVLARIADKVWESTRV
jgi:hypothetical protein